MLIEQALPQIESKANEILDRLSNGSMSVRFITQQKYKDQNREELRETLEIQISDSAGMRDYELFSGGEAFRINFAIRAALSELRPHPVLDVTGDDAITDWVVVELRDKNDAATVLETFSGLIQRDGDIVGLDGIDDVGLPVLDDDYFVAVRHRNHLCEFTQDELFERLTTFGSPRVVADQPFKWLLMHVNRPQDGDGRPEDSV